MEQTSLLPFVTGGKRFTCSSGEGEQESLNVKISSRPPPDHSVGREFGVVRGMYGIPVEKMTKAERAYHESVLTMTPIESGYVREGGGSFPAYSVSEGRMWVPKFYGVEQWGGKVAMDETSEGEVASLSFTGSLNPLQEEAVGAVEKRLREGESAGGAMLVLPCGYGKTVCALNLIARMGKRALVIVPKGFLVEQWQERAKAFLPGASLGRLQRDVVEDDRDIVVGMLQSLAMREYPEETLRKFGVVVVDEAHHCAARVFSRALNKIPAKFVVGLSATPERKDGCTQLLYWSMGKVAHRIEREAESVGVRCLSYDCRVKEPKARDGTTNMAMLLTRISQKGERNGAIASQVVLLLKEGRKVILLSDRVAQLEELKKRVEEKMNAHDGKDAKGGKDANDLQHGKDAKDLQHGKDPQHGKDAKDSKDDEVPLAAMYVGGSSKRERERAELSQLILSTWQMSKEGLDIPALDTLVMATPKGDVEQGIGRILRKHPSKKMPLVVDVVDDLPSLVGMKFKRLKYYQSQSYSCTTSSLHDPIQP